MYNLEGKKEKNIITFEDDTFKNVISVEENKITLSRKSNEVSYICIFDNKNKTSFKYNINEYNSYIYIEITTKKMEIDNNYIKVEYTQNIQGDIRNYEYILEWEEVK